MLPGSTALEVRMDWRAVNFPYPILARRWSMQMTVETAQQYHCNGSIRSLTASEQACSIFVGDASFILRTALV